MGVSRLAIARPGRVLAVFVAGGSGLVSLRVTCWAGDCFFLTYSFDVGCMTKLRFFCETCKPRGCIFAFLRAKKTGVPLFNSYKLQ